MLREKIEQVKRNQKFAGGVWGLITILHSVISFRPHGEYEI